MQVEWLEARPIEAPELLVEVWETPAQIIDYRQEAHPLQLLDGLRQQPGLQLWCEADDKNRLDGVDRTGLLPARNLAIWSIPPGPAELHAALQLVKPEVVVLFAVDPGLDRMDMFLRRLAGLVKYSLRSSQGWVSLPSLAAATAHRLATVRLGLDWLQAGGHLHIVSTDDNTALLEQGDGISQPGITEIATRLSAILNETAAYRQYYTRADKDALLKPS